MARATGHVDCCSCYASLDPADLRVHRVRKLATGTGGRERSNDGEIIAAWMLCPRCHHNGVLKLGSGDYLTDGDLAVLPQLDLAV